MVTPSPTIEAAHPLLQRNEAQRTPTQRPPIFLGTSSWSFPGWAMVFGKQYRESALAKSGLKAYSQHPLLNAVGLDRSFYAPLSEIQYAQYAAQVPADFRFLVKAPDLITGAQFRDDKGKPLELNPHHLDAALAADQFIFPAVAGLGDKLGCLVFQFSPLPRHWLTNSNGSNSSASWIDKLGHFLLALPPLVAPACYAVEIRDASLLTPRLMKALAAAGATYCIGLHDRLPPLARQLDAWNLWHQALRNQQNTTKAANAPIAAPFIVRWTLRRGMTYQSARTQFAPFTELHFTDDETIHLLADRIAQQKALGAVSLVIINNKAEGCAPLSVQRLDNAIAQRLSSLKTTS